MQITVTMSEGGRIVIPAELRQQIGIKPGDKLFVRNKSGKIEIESALSKFRSLQAKISAADKGKGSAADELITERRADAKRETTRTKK